MCWWTRQRRACKEIGWVFLPRTHPPTPTPPHPCTGLQICSEAGRSGLLAWHPLSQATVNKLKLENSERRQREKLGPMLLPEGWSHSSDSRAVMVQNQGSSPLPRTPKDATAALKVPEPLSQAERC